MAEEYNRSDRVGTLLQRELAVLIRDELKDPRLGMVTVQGVSVTRDLALAKVYFTVLNDPGVIGETRRILNGASAFLRRRLGRKLTLRSIPELAFVYDESVARGARMSALLEQALHADGDKNSASE